MTAVLAMGVVVLEPHSQNTAVLVRVSTMCLDLIVNPVVVPTGIRIPANGVLDQ